MWAGHVEMMTRRRLLAAALGAWLALVQWLVQPNALLAGVAHAGKSDAYIAPAIHLDGATLLGIDSIACEDNGNFSMSFWIKTTQAIDTPVIVGSDPTNNAYILTYLQSVLGTFQSAVSGPGNGLGIDVRTTGVVVNDGNWHNLIYAHEVNHPTETRLAKIYFDDVDVTDLFINGGDAFIPTVNGLPFTVGGDTYPHDWLIADIAELWAAPGVSLFTGNDISEGTRRLFISPTKKPVNPSGFPASPMLFSGNAATFGNNQGSGGAFTWTGVPTNASTSPSD